LRDQCLELAGLLCVVFSIICVTVRVEMDGVRPGSWRREEAHRRLASESSCASKPPSEAQLPSALQSACSEDRPQPEEQSDYARRREPASSAHAPAFPAEGKSHQLMQSYNAIVAATHIERFPHLTMMTSIHKGLYLWRTRLVPGACSKTDCHPEREFGAFFPPNGVQGPAVALQNLWIEPLTRDTASYAF
jgi:hypothetical protein